MLWKRDNMADEGNAADALNSFFNPLTESGLYKARTILITGEINEKTARSVTERLFAMSGDSDDPITVLVSSPGGHVESGDVIHDMIKFVKPCVRVLGAGWVASAGALIYVAAQKENRYSLPNTRFLLHEPRGGVQGSATEIGIQMREFQRMRERLNRIFSEATGQDLARIEADTNRDFWMSAQEAIEYGIVGQIITSANELA